MPLPTNRAAVSDQQAAGRAFVHKRLAARVQSRADLVERTREATVLIGQDIRTLKATGYTAAEIARSLGIPLSTLNDYAAAAGEFSDFRLPAPPIQAMNPSDMPNAVDQHGTLTEVIASTSPAELLAMSGLAPDRFLTGDNSVAPPPMLLRFQDGFYAAADPTRVAIGYSGSGPQSGQRLLESAGVDPGIAHQITHGYRNVHVELDATAPNWVTFQDNVVWGLTVPELVPGSDDKFRTRIRLNARAAGGREGGSAEERGRVLNWLAYLDTYQDDPTNWTAGERYAQLFDKPERAADNGFTTETSSQRRARRDGLLTGEPVEHYQLVIAQGRMELWLSAVTADDTPAWIAEEFHRPLRAAGLLDADFAELDESSAIRRLRNWFLRPERPEIQHFRSGARS